MHRTLGLVVLLAGCAAPGPEPAPAPRHAPWTLRSAFARGAGAPATVGTCGDGLLYVVDDADQDLVAPMRGVEDWGLAGPYLRVRVAGQDQLLGPDLRPATDLTCAFVWPALQRAARVTFALDRTGDLYVLRETTAQVEKIPGPWRGVQPIPAGTPYPLVFLERRDDPVGAVACATPERAWLVFPDAVGFDLRTLEGLPTDLRYGSSPLGPAGTCMLQLYHLQPAGAPERWLAYGHYDMTVGPFEGPTEAGALARAEATLRAHHARRKVEEEEVARRAAELLERQVAACREALDRGQPHADAYQAAVRAGDLGRARAAALALHEVIARLHVPGGHPASSILAGRLRTLRSVGIDWSARRPDRSLETVAAWLPVAFQSIGDDRYWETVEALVLASQGPPAPEARERLWAYSARLSAAARARIGSWATYEQRAAYDAALARGDWRGAASIAASLDPDLWGAAILAAPEGHLGSGFVDAAIPRVSAALRPRLEARREVEAQVELARNVPAPAAPGPRGPTMTEQLEELRQRIYMTNLTRYGLPPGY